MVTEEYLKGPYIVSDEEGFAIYGYGDGMAEAQMNAKEYIIEALFQNGWWSDGTIDFSAYFETIPCTQNLIEAVKKHGGECGWDWFNGRADVVTE